MPESVLRVTEINHVVLHVANLERSRRFYTEVLGFEDRTLKVNPGQATSPHPTMTFLQAGSQGLDLFEVPEGDVHGGEEMNHMALSVEAVDIGEAAAVLKEAGIEVSGKTPRNTAFISDPDGHRIEILPRTANARVLDHHQPPQIRGQ
jgi:catechol 2,3-dioxygenase-like lactoylglutathione lyase family enzyme